MIEAIREWFRSTTDIRRGERLTVALMFAYGFLAMASYYLVKPARNSIFVDRIGADGLSYAYVITAVFVALVMVGYSRYVDRVGRQTLLQSTFAFLIASLVLFWWLLTWDTSVWTSGAFYLYTKLYALLLVSQFWLVANLLFTTRQAKRLFGVTGLGLIVGAAVGSAVAGLATSAIGTEYLLLLAAGFVALCAVIVLGLSARMREGEDTSGRVLDELSGDAVRLLWESPHLRTIAGILALTVLVHTLMDWQLNRATEIAIPGEDAKTLFWGRFYFVLNIGSIAIQLFFTAFVLRRFGVGLALLILPLSLLVASIGIVLLPVLLVVAFAEGMENAIRYSLDQSTRETLYLPVATATKYKVKPLIDLAVYRGGTGLAGVVLLVTVNMLGGDIRAVAVVALLLAAAWVALAVRMRREYLQTLAHSIDRGFASMEGAFDSIATADVLPVVREALSGDEPPRIAFVLDLVDRSAPSDARLVADDLHRLLQHDSPRIRARALEVLTNAPEVLEPNEVRRRLHDPSERVRRRAVRAVLAASPDRGASVVEELLGADEREVRLATLACLTGEEVSVAGGDGLGRAYVEGRRIAARAGDPDARLELALAAGAIVRRDEAVELLEPLLDDDDARIASAAIRSAGRIGDGRFDSRLVAALADPGTRAAARTALIARGSEAVDVLAEHLMDPDEAPAVRRHIPSVLARIPTPATVTALIRLHLAPETDQLLDDRTLEALSTLRAGDADLTFDVPGVTTILDRELAAARRYAETRAVLRREGVGGRAARLLDRALEDGREQRRENAFRCLGLLHDPERTHGCYLTIVSGDERARDNALEWLEETVGHARFGKLGPVLLAPDRDFDTGRELPDALRELWNDPDTFLARCALWTAAEEAPDRARTDLAAYEPRSPELAALADRLEERGVERARVRASPDRDLELIEKVLLLRDVDLLREARSSDLALLASIAEERELPAEAVVFRRGEANDSLYVVIRGAVQLTGMAGQTLTAGERAEFGTWALIDSAPSEVGARVLEAARLLRITRDEFRGLLTDHPELAAGMLEALARRVRGLAAA